MTAECTANQTFMLVIFNFGIYAAFHKPSHSTKAPYRKGVKDVIRLVQSRKIFFIFSSVKADLQTIMWSFYLPTSD